MFTVLYVGVFLISTLASKNSLNNTDHITRRGFNHINQSKPLYSFSFGDNN